MKAGYALCAVLAVVLYAFNSPFSKLLLESVSPGMMASLLYIGAGIGTFLILTVKAVSGSCSFLCRFRGNTEGRFLYWTFVYASRNRVCFVG